MPVRQINSVSDRAALITYLEHKKPPFVASITDGRRRSIAQNKLQRLWLNEAADQLQEYTAEQYRAYCKLHFGIPILRGENEDFCKAYDRVIRSCSYEDKLEMMAVPLDFPVTRLMKSGQKARYLDDMFQHFLGLGVLLTQPESEH